MLARMGELDENRGSMVVRNLAWVRVLACASAMALLAGCAAYKAKSQSLLLEAQVKNYAKSIRWSDWETAVTFLRERDGTLPVLDITRYDGIRVTRSDYTVAAPAPDALEATMVASFDYQYPDSVSVRSVTQQALWWYDPTYGRWFLEGSLPDF